LKLDFSLWTVNSNKQHNSLCENQVICGLSTGIFRVHLTRSPQWGRCSANLSKGDVVALGDMLVSYKTIHSISCLAKTTKQSWVYMSCSVPQTVLPSHRLAN